LAQSIEFNINPSEETFKLNRDLARLKKTELSVSLNAEDENLRQVKNRRDSIIETKDELVETIQTLQVNKSNIPIRETEIREEILQYVGATKEEIPFIGELIRINENERQWELSIEKILHNFALRLIVPEKYYSKVNEYVNKTNLKGRIIYQRYRGYTSFGDLAIKNIATNALINKLDFKPKNPYTDWLEEVISIQYNYACVNDLVEFNRYEEKAVTKEGLIKFARGKHEKDDRPHISRKENFILGWDNKDKIRLLQAEVRELQEKEKVAINEIRLIDLKVKSMNNKKEAFDDLFKIYTKFDDIDWQTFAKDIQEKEVLKSILEKTNDRVQALQKQLRVVQDSLKKVSEVEIFNKSQEIFNIKKLIEDVKKGLNENNDLLAKFDRVNVVDFEKSNSELLKVNYSNIKFVQSEFQNSTSDKISKLIGLRREKEDDVKLRINSFKLPDENITIRFKDWRSDVSRLPDSTHLEFINEYQSLLKQLIEDNLPKFEKKFNEYLQETITHKVGDFRMFFENWAYSIKENIRHLNESLKEIDFRNSDFKTYIQLVSPNRINDEIKEFRALLNSAIPNIREMDATIDGRKNHFNNHIEPLIAKLEKEDWRKRVMEVRSWFSYKAEEFYKETNLKFKTYENMGQLSGGEKAQLTYTILGSAIAYQFGLTKQGLQSDSFRFIAIDEAFKSQDEDKARYLITLCKQLHLQLLVVTPSDNIHIVENDISFVHFVERKEEKYSWLYDMPIKQFKEKRANFINQ